MEDICLVEIGWSDPKFEWLVGSVYMNCVGVREEENILKLEYIKGVVWRALDDGLGIMIGGDMNVHLLQDYKHRVFGEPNNICTDSGASPQDVRHLFACTTHPTDLSPGDLWRNPVRSICAFSYLDNGNLEDGPGRGKNNNMNAHIWDLDGCENENGRRMKENMNEIGLQILNCVWDGLNEATRFTEEKKFTLDYMCMDGRGMKKVVGASIPDLREVIESDHAAIRVEIEWKGVMGQQKKKRCLNKQGI